MKEKFGWNNPPASASILLVHWGIKQEKEPRREPWFFALKGSHVFIEEVLELLLDNMALRHSCMFLVCFRKLKWAIGQLVHKHSQQNIYIHNTSGLVAEVLKNGEPLVKFFYNDRNQRVKKEHYAPNNFLFATTYYVRDVAGQVMAVYNDVGGDPALEEQPVYGAGRIVVAYSGNNNEKTYVYEPTDHLGNVRAVFTKSGADDHQVEGYTDYYPGGMAMPNRTLSGAEGYRYAFQGQEKDPETGKEAFELRLWDSRIGRWLTTDPAGQYNSPYLGMGNNPISKIDSDGGKADDVYILHEDGSTELLFETNDPYDILIAKSGAMIVRKGILDNQTSYNWTNNKTGSYFTLYEEWDDPKSFFEFVSTNTHIEWGQVVTNSGVHYIGRDNFDGSSSTTSFTSAITSNLFNRYSNSTGFIKFNNWREINHSHPDGSWGPDFELGLGFLEEAPSGFNADFSKAAYFGDRANADQLQNTLKYAPNAKFHVYDVANKNYIHYDSEKVHNVKHFNEKL